MNESDEAVWRKRFLVFTGVRLFGLAVFLLAIAIAFSDLAREGGWPLVGGLVAIAGALDAVISPRLLKKVWEREDQSRK